MPEISVTVPVYNEEESLSMLCEKLHETLSGIERTYEILLVDDGSTDGTWEVMLDLTRKYPCIRLIKFRRNFGQTAAMSAGFRESRGEIVVTMDADLQNDPADIPKLLAKMDEGFDVVSGWRKKRNDPFLSRCLPSTMANALIGRITGVRLHDYGCTLKAYRRDIMKDVHLYGEMHRFIPVLADMKGYKIGQVKVANRPRGTGETKYGIERLWRGMLDSITVLLINRYSEKPLHLFGSAGLILLALGGLIHVFVVIEKAFMGIPFKNSMGLITLGMIVLTLAFNLFSVGLIMEYVLSRSIKSSDQYTIAEIV